jgi:cyclic pyranopterin phosphate synthase
MPREVFGEKFRFLPRAQLLTFEEIRRLAGVFHQLGVRKFRITGGEPLLRHDIDQLVGMLSTLPEVELALTTNAALLAELAPPLVSAGLRRVTVSLDSLDDEVFRCMNDVDFPVEKVLEGIDAARSAGLEPVKVNAMIRRGVNDHTALDMVRHFKGSGCILRFIEYMDVGTTNGWRLDEVVPSSELVDQVGRVFPIEPIAPNYPGEVARRWRFADGSGEIGFISSVSQPFCGSCSRARLSAEGQLYTCLFASGGTDLKAPLRAGATEDELLALLGGIWERRSDRYSEVRTAETAELARIEMSYIGG